MYVGILAGSGSSVHCTDLGPITRSDKGTSRVLRRSRRGWGFKVKGLGFSAVNVFSFRV